MQANKNNQNPERTILCYGDSNTWGYEPLTGARLPRKQRWPTLLQAILGDSYHVIPEGLNGRTTSWNVPYRAGRNGRKSLLAALESHCPLSLVAIMLGTNDLKHHLNVSAYESSLGLSSLIKIVNTSEAGIGGLPPKALVIAPPKFGKLSEKMANHFSGGADKSMELATYYRQACIEQGCDFYNANDAVSTGADGIHLDSINHRILAEALAPVVRRIVEAET